MPNRKHHVKAGGRSAFLLEFLFDAGSQFLEWNAGNREKINWGRVVTRSGVAYLGGSIGGTIPDRLEPATHPNHRKSCHSVAAGTAVAFGITKIERLDVHFLAKSFLRGTAVGYVKHLVDDSATSKGLPII